MTRIKMVVLFAVLLVNVMLAHQAGATLITYTDRTSFNASNLGVVVEGFENAQSTGTRSFSTPLDSTTNVAGLWSPGAILPGVRFELTEGTDAYFAAPGQSSNTTNAIGVNWPTSAGWNIFFAAGTSAFAVDIFQNFGGGAQSGSTITENIDIYGIKGLLGSFTTTVPSGFAGFFGISSDTDLITKVTVNNINSFDVIDNVAFNYGQSAPVPEPSTFLLLGAGLVGAGFLRRKARK